MTTPTLYCATADLIAMFPAAARAPAPQLTLAVTMASAYVENHTQRVLSQATYTHEQSKLIVNRDNQIVGKVRQWPIVAVTAASYLPVGTPNLVANELALDPAYIDFMTPPERLFYYDGPVPSGAFPGNAGYRTGGARKSMRGVIFATYTAGFATIPQDVRTAAILLSQYFLSRNANALGAAAISVSAPTSTNSISFARRSTLLDDAEKILDAYVRRE